MAAKERLDVLECEPEDELFAHTHDPDRPLDAPEDTGSQDSEVKP